MPKAELAVGWLHLAVLWALGMAQPLFNVLADDPAFFVARGNTAGDILILAFGLVLVPPTVLVAIEALLYRVSTVRQAVHLAFIALLAALFALQVLADLAPGTTSVLLIPLAVIAGTAIAVAYRRTRFVPSMLTVLSPAPIVFLALFLLFSDVSKLVFPEGAQDVQASVRSDTPVVFVVLDEFSGLDLLDRGGRIDGSRFPNLAALARGSTWYRNATTVTDHTSRAVPVILSGQRSSNDKLPITSDYPDNLFTLLGGDYKLDVHETASHLCPDDLCERQLEPQKTRLRSLARDLRTVSLRRLLPDDLASRLPAVNRTFGSFQQSGAQLVSGAVKGNDQSTPQARGLTFETFTRGIREGTGDRTLHFLHILLPHIPWLFLPTGQQYSENGRPIPGLDAAEDRWDKAAWAPRQAFQRYLLQAEYVDRLVGQLMDDLRKVGLYDRSLIVLVADHGVSFRPGDVRRRVTPTNFADLASVPLFIKAPGQRRGRTDETHARTVDVLPTVADYLGVDLPWKTDGRSLRHGSDPGPATVSVAPPKGPSVELPFTAFKRQRDAFAAQALDLFSRTPRGTYELRTDADLIDRPLNAFSVVRRPGARVDLDASQSFQSVDPKGAVVPAFVTGSLSGIGVGERLAVAVNGRIAAGAYSFEDLGRTSFAALVPPYAYRRGANRIQVLSVRGAGANTALAMLGQSTAERYELVDEGGHEVLRSSSGKRAQVEPGAVTGFVEGVDVIPGGVSVRGWAVAIGRGSANRIVVYVGDRLVAQGAPTEVRDDVAKIRGPEARGSGFVLSGNTGQGGTPSPSDVRVFAIFGDEASELPRAG